MLEDISHGQYPTSHADMNSIKDTTVNKIGKGTSWRHHKDCTTSNLYQYNILTNSVS